jgi:hypothetical protein
MNIEIDKRTITSSPLPDVHDFNVGDYVTFYPYTGASLAWGLIRERMTRIGRVEKFVENEMLPKFHRQHIYFSQSPAKGEFFAYKLPDENMNALMRELPQESVHEMFGMNGKDGYDRSDITDRFGNQLEMGDLISYVAVNGGIKLGRVKLLDKEKEKTFVVPLDDINSPLVQRYSSQTSIFQTTSENRKQIHALSDQDIHDFYFTRFGDWR